MKDHDKEKTLTSEDDRPQKDYSLNPLLEDGPEGVVMRVICMMEYLSSITLSEGMVMDTNMTYGQWLIYETILNALKCLEEENIAKQKA